MNRKIYLWFPLELLVCLPGVSEQLLHLRGAVELGVDPHPHHVRPLLPAHLRKIFDETEKYFSVRLYLLVPRPRPLDLLADVLERRHHKLSGKCNSFSFLSFLIILDLNSLSTG